MGRPKLDSSALSQGQQADSCEDGDESSVSMKCVGFLDQLMNCELLNKDSARRIFLLSYVVSYSNLNKQSIGRKCTPLILYSHQIHMD
jgi:hypothetical protein